MEKLSREEAFASQNYDPEKVVITGVPEHHIEALKAAANLFVAHDAVNPNFQPDYSNYDQLKYYVVHSMSSSSGARFAYDGYNYWYSSSDVGSRLESESPEAVEHIAEICHEDYKKLKEYKREIK